MTDGSTGPPLGPDVPAEQKLAYLLEHVDQPDWEEHFRSTLWRVKEGTDLNRSDLMDLAHFILKVENIGGGVQLLAEFLEVPVCYLNKLMDIINMWDEEAFHAWEFNELQPREAGQEPVCVLEPAENAEEMAQRNWIQIEVRQRADQALADVERLGLDAIGLALHLWRPDADGAEKARLRAQILRESVTRDMDVADVAMRLLGPKRFQPRLEDHEDDLA